MAESKLETDIGILYDKVIAYLSSCSDNLGDPTLPMIEFQDNIEEYELSDLIYYMQLLSGGRPTLIESKLIKAYRDLRSAQAEYAMRLTTRSEYYIDALLEGNDNILKWEFNKKQSLLHISGNDIGD